MNEPVSFVDEPCDPRDPGAFAAGLLWTLIFIGIIRWGPDFGVWAFDLMTGARP